MNARISMVLAAVAAAAVAVPPAARAQSAFEGVVTFESSAGPNGRQSIQYSVKGSKVRMDISAQGMAMFTLFDTETNTYDMVMPQRHMYVERTIQDAQALADSAVGNTKVEWTGTKETIAGCECEHANVTDSMGNTVDACLTKGLGTFMGGMQGGPGRRGGRGRGGMGSGWAGHVGATFPLKVVRDGQVEMLVTSIEKKSLDDSLFAVPSGYQKMGMPGRGRGGPGGR